MNPSNLFELNPFDFNPCTACGACCAFYRASFYWGETDAVTPGGVPESMTRPLNAFRVMMKGTQGGAPWCIALLGIIGKQARCSIYERRATVCRDFAPSWRNGQPNPDCDKARAAWGLAPLSPDSWSSPGDCPRAA